MRYMSGWVDTIPTGCARRLWMISRGRSSAIRGWARAGDNAHVPFAKGTLEWLGQERRGWLTRWSGALRAAGAGPHPDKRRAVCAAGGWLVAPRWAHDARWR